jgi:hypothetical protein
MNLCVAYYFKETGKERESVAMLNNAVILYNEGLKNVPIRRWHSMTSRHLILNLASAYAMLNDSENSLKYLYDLENRGFVYGWQDYIEISPFYDNLREHPEFKAIVKRVQDKIATVRDKVKEMEVREGFVL